MECLGPQCATLLLEWFKEQSRGQTEGGSPPAPVQGRLWNTVPYQDDAPAIRSAAELEAAFEQLEYSVYRRFQNQLTRAERIRLDNTIRNALFKVDRYLSHLHEPDRSAGGTRASTIRAAVADAHERAEGARLHAQRVDRKLAQLGSLSPEGFEEFVAELFEALGFDVDRVGGTGDEGADLRVEREELRGVVQCKYQSHGVVGSPVLQKFLGTIHHTRSHKGFFVTTGTFTLAAERFVAEHPIELIDGPRLVELVQQALGPQPRREPAAAWF